MSRTLEWLQESAGWIAGVLAGATALVLVLRLFLRWLHRQIRRGNDALETLLGRDEIRHPDTDELLVEATPSLGKRLGRIDIAVSQNTQTIAKLVETHTEVTRLTTRIDTLTDRLEQHVADSVAGVQARTEEHLEMWRTIRAIAVPQHDNGPEKTPEPNQQ